MPFFRYVVALLSLWIELCLTKDTPITEISHRINAPQSLLTYISSIRREKRDEGRAAWRRGSSGKWEEPRNVEENLYFSPEKFQVVSSSLRILPKKGNGRSGRRKRSEGEWKKPKRHQFVTNSRLGKYLDPDPLRYYPGERPYLRPPTPRRVDNRRIIYYATLPEIVKHPLDWSPPPPRSEGYPPLHENEVVTRVRSPLIDVSNADGRKPYERGYPGHKITIIDAEPPYYRYPPRYDPYYYGGWEDPRGRPYYFEPYGHYEPRPPPPADRHVIIPPLPNSFTVVKKPLDVRPLDPIRDLPTTPSSADHSTTASSTTTTTINPIRNFERTFKY